MIRNSFIGFLWLCFPLLVQSQTAKEWFKQKETQKKYLLKQIAGFQLYLGYIKEGYSMVNSGIGLISNHKNGDFQLHNKYFNSLLKPSAKVQNYIRIGNILDLQIQMVRICRDAKKNVTSGQMFTPKDAAYIYGVFDRLLSGCISSIELLAQLTTSEQFNLTDAERIKRIDGIYSDMLDKYWFARSFNHDINIVKLVRTQEQRNVNRARLLNDIKK